MKKTICLYRVSTMGQVDKQENDIPAQREKCRSFAKSQGWSIVDEYTELGVSGFKVSAKDRDAIQEIRHRAENKEFDVLLVFMFDRIGRRHDETPFVVEWFINNGVEVWSTQEGQQRLENDGDHLINYLRFWAAPVESKKTSMRTRNGLEQLVREGHFKGGTSPYGYRLEKTGRISKRGIERYDLVADDYEASIIRDIFNCYANKGMGTFQIAMQLTNQGIPSRSGGWVAKTILYILKNNVYIGMLRSGETCTGPFNHLQIVTDEIFERAQVLIQERARKNSLTRTVPMSSRGKAILSGNIFCGHCGGRLTATTSGRVKINANGEAEKRVCYICYNKSRKRKECDGACSYTSTWVDDAVIGAVKELFAQLTGSPKDDILSKVFDAKMDDLQIQLTQAKESLRVESDELQTYESEIIKCLTGKSRFSEEVLSKQIDLKSEIVNKLKLEVGSLERQVNAGTESIKNTESKLSYLATWADLFDASDMETKKMIIANVIKQVTVSKDYVISIEYNVEIEKLRQVA